MNKNFLIVIIFLSVVAVFAAGYFFRAVIVRQFYAPTENSIEQGIGME